MIFVDEAGFKITADHFNADIRLQPDLPDHILRITGIPHGRGGTGLHMGDAVCIHEMFVGLDGLKDHAGLVLRDLACLKNIEPEAQRYTHQVELDELGLAIRQNGHLRDQ